MNELFVILVEPASTFLDSDSLEDLDPKLGELLYSDQIPTNPKELNKKSDWLNEAYFVQYDRNVRVNT